MRRVCLQITACLIVFGLTAARAPAAEPYVAFLRALQEQGFGEMAMLYIATIEARPDLPAELKDTLDLERCKSLQIAAQEAYTPDEAEKRLASAQTYLDKFLKEKPEHPEVAAALVAGGDFSFERGQRLLAIARGIADKAEAAKQMAAAQEAFKEARPRFEQAAARYQKRMDELAAQPEPEPDKTPKSKKPPAEDETRSPKLRAELGGVEATFKLALVDYHLAHAIIDEKDPNRKKALEQAASQFDAIYQKYRENVVAQVRLHAHAWHGRAVADLGDLQTALDIYDEVLANAPDNPAKRTELDALFADVQLSRLKLVGKLAGAEGVAQEAEEWLATHRTWTKVAGYQGVFLELARANLAMAEKLGGAEKTKVLRGVMADLATFDKVDSPYKEEALLLSRQLREKLGSTVAGSADENITVGDANLRDKKWAEAEKAYTEAIAVATKAKDPKKLAVAKERLGMVRYQMALTDYSAGKYEEALKSAELIAKLDSKEEFVGNSAGLAVYAAHAIFASPQTTDKKAAFKRLQDVANFVMKKWENEAEADDAKIALGQATRDFGDTAGALKLLGEVDKRSKRYPFALQAIGQIQWRTYLQDRGKTEATRDAKAMAENLAEAQKNLEQAVTLLEAQVKDDESLKRSLNDTSLLLAEVSLEAKQGERAVQLLAPLVAELEKSKPDQIDNTILRTCISGARAYMSVGKVDEAKKVADILIQSGPDIPAVNGVLVDFAKSLTFELQSAEANLAKATASAEQAKIDAATKIVTDTKTLLTDILKQLGTRQQLSLAAMVYLADTAKTMGLPEQARASYEAILQRAANDPSFQEEAAKAMTRVHSQLADLLRAEGKYEDAMVQVEALVKDHPNALEPMMVKGRILQEWAKTDAKRGDEAVAHWTRVRMLLSRMPKKPRAYYEVIYYAADSLMTQAGDASLDAKGKAEKALQAEKLLKSQLVLTPKLSGDPKQVAEYELLIKRAIEAQGRKS